VPTTDDSALVSAVRSGDRAAFGRLVERHAPRARHVVRGLVDDRDDAEDIVQEAILNAYIGIDRLNHPERFGSWLCGIALNLSRMRVRRARTGAALEEVAGGIGLPSAAIQVPERALEEFDAVRTALAVLPPAQRQLVFMHYVQGLSCEEIATILGSSNGAVRVSLHRARSRLRRHLLQKEELMIEVDVEDVVVRVLKDSDETQLPELASELRIVLLREKDGERLLPIWIGSMEGNALALALRGELGLRPLTFDLTARLLELTGGRIERAVVSRLAEKTFYATLAVRTADRLEELDARPSDAINLAVRLGAPIYVQEEVMEISGIAGRDEVDAEADAIAEGPPGEWLTLSPELVTSMWEAKIRK
jgi:RNA polymerase sigma factor (sigma-70 family)